MDSRSSQCTEWNLFTLPRPIPSCLPSLPVTRPKRPVHMACSEKQLSNPMSSPTDPSSPLGSQSSSLLSVASKPLVKLHRMLWEKNSGEGANGQRVGSSLALEGAGRSQLRDEDPSTPHLTLQLQTNLHQRQLGTSCVRQEARPGPRAQ